MDKNYWDIFYKKYGKENTMQQHSTFSEFCQTDFFKNKTLNIVELGSGNGRDSIYFAKNNHNVTAIDQSDIAINIEKENLSSIHKDNIYLKNTNFILEDYSDYPPIDVFYSRFTMHSIEENDENIILLKVFNALSKHGLFCIEARTIKDPLYGQGESLGNHAYRTDHFRRFIDTSVFLKKILDIGFKLRYFVEANNLSIYKDDNPVLMRIILEK